MRNLILSAFPRNMRLPDPFTPNLKVEMLPDISIAPRTVANYAALIKPGFKKVSSSCGKINIYLHVFLYFYGADSNLWPRLH